MAGQGLAQKGAAGTHGDSKRGALAVQNKSLVQTVSQRRAGRGEGAVGNCNILGLWGQGDMGAARTVGVLHSHLTSKAQTLAPACTLTSPAGLFVSQTIAEAESLRVLNLENKITKERKKPRFY